MMQFHRESRSLGMRRSLLFFCCALPLFAQAPVRTNIDTLKFPAVETNIVYGRNSVTQQLEGGPITTGTLYRSDDAARTWTTLFVAPRGDYQFIDDFAVHPERPNIVYAVRTRARGGFFRSEDSGQTWEAINAGLPAIGELRNVAIVRAATEEGRVRIGDVLYRLDPVAKSWSKLSDLPASTTVIAFDIRTAQRGAVLAQPGNYYSTNNGGATWVSQGRIPAASNLIGHDIAFDAKDPNYLYFRTEAVANSQGRCLVPAPGLWRTTDGGRSYSIVYESEACNVTPNVWVDPARPNVYIRTNFVSSPYCRSTNRGESFTCERDTSLQTSTPSLIAMNPRNGDLFRSSLSLLSRDGASSWQSFESTFRPTLHQPAPYSASITEGEATTANVRVSFMDYAVSTPFRATLIDAVPWATLSATTGNLTSSSTMGFRVDAGALAPGIYTVRARLESDAAANSPVTITLQLTVVPRAITGVRYRYQRLSGGITNTRAVTRDAQGNIYTMTDRRIRRIAPNGTVTIIAGDGTQGETPDNTPAAQAKFAFVDFLAIARDGTMYIAEGIATKIYSLKDGIVRVVMDSTSPTSYRLQSIRGMSVSPSGTVFASDATRIVKLEPGRTPEVVSGFGNFPAAAGASLFDMAAESDNSWIFTDPLSNRVFRWNSSGLTTIAGSRVEGFSGDGGPATQAALDSPTTVAVDTENNVILWDNGNGRLRVVRPDGRIFSLTGGVNAPNFSASGDSGVAADTRFSGINSIAIEPNGDLLVTDFSSLYRFSRQPFPTPAIQSGSAVNSASNQPALSPGALITVYGANLSLETRAANFAPLVTALGGAEILLNDQPLPIVFSSPGQVNAQIPPAFPLGPAKLRARVDGKLSAEIDVMIAAAGPGIFVYGNNRAVAQNQDGAINGEASPEAPGKYAVLYVTGIGATDNVVAAGALSPASPLARATLPFELRVGDVIANVIFAGLTPGFVGLGQVNFEVPELSAGDYPITLRIAGLLSNAPIFAVGQP